VFCVILFYSDNRAFEVVVEKRGEALGFVEQHRIAFLEGPDSQPVSGIAVAFLQEPVDIVDSVEPVIAEAENDLIVSLSFEDG